MASFGYTYPSDEHRRIKNYRIYSLLRHFLIENGRYEILRKEFNDAINRICKVHTPSSEADAIKISMINFKTIQPIYSEEQEKREESGPVAEMSANIYRINQEKALEFMSFVTSELLPRGDYKALSEMESRRREKILLKNGMITKEQCFFKENCE